MPYRKRGEKKSTSDAAVPKDISLSRPASNRVPKVNKEDDFFYLTLESDDEMAEQFEWEMSDAEVDKDSSSAAVPKGNANTGNDRRKKKRRGIRKQSKSNTARVASSPGNKTDLKDLECNYCHRVLCSKVARINHERRHTGEQPYKRELCDDPNCRLHDVMKHARGHCHKKYYPCQFCQKPFFQITHLRNHFRTHTRERPFKCEVCLKRFMQMEHLMKHRFIHTGERPFKCDVCKKCFKYTQDLKRHSYIHTGERPYECSVCQKTFNQSSALRVHERIHTGEKPYQCSICMTWFREQGTLQKHLQRRHTEPRASEDETGCTLVFLGPEDLEVIRRVRRE